MSSKQDFATPTARARGLGSAKAGTDHHIRQRVSAIALIVLRWNRTAAAQSTSTIWPKTELRIDSIMA